VTSNIKKSKCLLSQQSVIYQFSVQTKELLFRKNIYPWQQTCSE